MSDAMNKCHSGRVMKLKWLPHAPAGKKLPARGTPGSAGLDLYATRDWVLSPFADLPTRIPIGFCAELPEGTVGIISSRSGMATKNGVHTVAGIMDQDYQHEWMVALENRGETSFEIRAGDAIAQLLIVPIIPVDIEVGGEFRPSARVGGFGSTNVAPAKSPESPKSESQTNEDSLPLTSGA
jgi:dUTP pyrophosphatase